jgi:hypothetical protein
VDIRQKSPFFRVLDLIIPIKGGKTTTKCLQSGYDLVKGMEGSGKMTGGRERGFAAG